MLCVRRQATTVFAKDDPPGHFGRAASDSRRWAHDPNLILGPTSDVSDMGTIGRNRCPTDVIPQFARCAPNNGDGRKTVVSPDTPGPTVANVVPSRYQE
jgi:hypothetical protein